MSNAHKDMFAGLIMTLSQSALLHMGKLVNPATGKTEMKLEYAQESIDMLDMLEAKTKGNLDVDEDRMLKETLGYLKVNYVETMQSAPAKPEAAQAPEVPKTGESPAAENSDPDSKVKFRKSFG